MPNKPEPPAGEAGRDELLAQLDWLRRRVAELEAPAVSSPGAGSGSGAGSDTDSVESTGADAGHREDLYRAILENVTDIYYRTDLDGRIVLITRAVTDIAGYDPKELKGKLMSDFYAHPSGRTQFLKELQESHGNVKNYEAAIRTVDGEIIWVSTNAHYYRDAGGKVAGVEGTVRDITELRRIEAAKRLSEQRLARIVLQTPLGVIDWDMNFRVVSWNKAARRIFGYSEKEALGREAGGLIVPDSQRELVNQIWTKLITNQGGARSTNENITKDGRSIHCEWYNTPLIDDQGAVIGVASIVQDVTEQRQMEEQLRQSQKMEAVGQLAGGMAHEFNNMLQIIMGFTDLALLDIPESDKRYSYLKKARNTAQRGADLVTQILGFSRQIPLKFAGINMNDLLSSLVEGLMGTLGENIETRLELDPELKQVWADEGAIQQVLVNICLNARDAMPNGGELRMKTGNRRLEREIAKNERDWAEPGEYVQITIEDTGGGMSREVMKQVFEPFYTTKGPQKGTGLGLAVVYGIVRDHKGLIRLSSTPGKGSTFQIYLPVSSKEAPPVERLAATTRPKGSGTILVAEDEEEIRSLISHTLENAGYKVLPASDGEEAVRLFDENGETVDLVLLDMVMPKMGGKEAYQRIKSLRPDALVIFHTAHDASAIDKEFLSETGLKALQKPYSANLLLQSVTDILESH